MKTLFISLVFSLSIGSIFSQTNYAKQLIGSWQFKNENGTLNLVFQSESQLIFDNSTATYTANATSLNVMADGQYINYPYSLNGNTLQITFPDGYVINFNKVSSTTTNAISTNGKEYLLKGNLCSYSSSSGGGYSSTTRVYFDGQGKFQYKSESSYSGESGSYASGDNGVETGKYVVENNQIALYFPDGSVGYAEIFFRQDDGSISEIKYEGTIYAKNLCD